MLNKEQEEIVNYDESALIIAGAGSGKTHTLVYRIKELVDRGEDPDSILALTFTKKAAGEMNERLDGCIDNVYNFHALALDLMVIASKDRPELMLPFKRGYSILDDYEQASILSRAIKAHDNFKIIEGSIDFYTAKGAINRSSLTNFIGRIQNLKDNSSAELVTLASWNEAERLLVDAYESYQKEHNALDFSDMIRIGVKICEGLGDIGFKHIFVDELQDTNNNQFLFLDAIYKGCNKPIMFGVGDIDQAIYEWRSAKPQNVYLFQKMFNAEMFKLVQNYRSKSNIVFTANSLIENNKQRIDKVMVPVSEEEGFFDQIFPGSEKDEAFYFADVISQLGDDETAAVLMRTNKQLNGVEALLRSRGISFSIRKDASMMNRADVKCVNAILNLALHPANPNSLSRVLSLMDGFGTKSIDDAILNNGRSLTKFTVKTKESWDEVQSLLHKIREFDREDNSDGIMSLFEYKDRKSEYTTMDNVGDGLTLLKNLYDDPDAMDKGMERIGLYTDALSNFNGVQNFLYGMSLDTGNDNSGNNGEDPNVFLQTIHGSKGLEFDTVLIGGISEDHYKVDDEEARRLLYVAMTRAKSRLIMSAPSFGMGRVLTPSEMMKESSLETMEEKNNISLGID